MFVKYVRAIITSFKKNSFPTSVSFIRIHIIANQLKKCSSIKELECVYATIVKTNANLDCFLAKQFISFCTSRFHFIDYTILVFPQMQEPNVFVYHAFSSLRHPLQAIAFYLYMLRAEVLLTTVHGQVWKNGFSSPVFVQTAMVDNYSYSNKFFESRRVSRRLFDEMPERKFATWNTMIDAYARLAELLFNKMPAWDIRSWTTMITSYSQNKQFREALDAFNKTKKSGTGSDQVTMATVLSACAHLGALDLGRGIQIYCRSLGRSLLVFFKLREKNLLCWNSITEALAIHGFAHEALGMFDRMTYENVRPNG
ncbi:hypothetical protein CISIN_1g044412mg, partial [Citrus sinensis]